MPGPRIAILTSGGDAPGMNAAIRAATLVGQARGATVLGVRHGYRGLVEGDFHLLERADVQDIVRQGGTMLGTARCPEFAERSVRDVARRRLKDARVDKVLVIGGNGSLTGAHALGQPVEQLEDWAVKVVGLPASIDNDVGCTSLAIGVDTAMNTIVEAADRIADTATAHDRTFIVEVMGRDCGYLAMAAGVGAGADRVLFREAGLPFDEVVDKVCDTVRAAHARGNKRALVIMSEGIQVPVAELKTAVDARLAGLGDADPEAELRVTVLGHLVRGGRPSALDRLMASRVAHAAVHGLLTGAQDQMVAWNPGRPPTGATRSPVDPRCWLVPLADVLTETKALLDGTSPQAQWRVKVFDELEGVFG
ncbi:MAG: 6-phosphofructokinase [Myxococcales bacterium]|nr:6-phosphofructokinase [Myxococcales bacterium]MCB9523863.1 6-phosphofructokinase [Myxococcales bacterium]